MSERVPNHRPRKRFGQNFLHDRATIDRIIQVIAPRPGQALVEIGPGQGALTYPLLRAAHAMAAVEMDRDLVAALRDRAAEFGALDLYQGDALEFDFAGLAEQAKQPLRIVGNLPYNISTPLLFHLFGALSQIRDMHFMLQREVVDRMAAAAGSAAYGRLSVMTQYHCAVERLLVIPPGAFFPPPKVQSAFVRLTPHAEPPVAVHDPLSLPRVVAQAFSQRRKTLRNSLKPLLSEQAILEAEVDPSLRPERLDLDAFARLANRLSRGTQTG